MGIRDIRKQMQLPIVEKQSIENLRLWLKNVNEPFIIKVSGQPEKAAVHFILALRNICQRKYK